MKIIGLLVTVDLHEIFLTIFCRVFDIFIDDVFEIHAVGCCGLRCAQETILKREVERLLLILWSLSADHVVGIACDQRVADNELGEWMVGSEV